MKSNYTFQRKEEYLLLTISGEYEKIEFLSYPALIANECHKEKVFKVLVNALDLKNSNPPTMDRFFLGEEIAKVLGPKIKLAVVWPKKDINKFAENVAVNRGARVIAASEISEAEKWLLDIS